MQNIHRPETSSSAWSANMAQTDEDVTVSATYAPLQEVVESKKGLSKKLDYLLYEVSHSFRNWQMILPDLRSFVLKNIGDYTRHPLGPQCFALFVDIFFTALADCQKNNKLAAKVVEAMLAYVDKLLNALKPADLPAYEHELNACFTRICTLKQNAPAAMMHIVQGHHPVRRIVEKATALDTALSASGKAEGYTFDFSQLFILMRTILEQNYTYWLSEETDPFDWFTKQCQCGICYQQEGKESGYNEKLLAISHEAVKGYWQTLQVVNEKENPKQALSQINTLPNHRQMVRWYREIPGMLEAKAEKESGAWYKNAPQAGACLENCRLLFLFRIMDTRGLYLIHEDTLRQINRSLILMIRKQTYEEIEDFFKNTFHLLKVNVRRYPDTSLQCIQVIGNEVFQRGNSSLVEAFLWQAVRFGFQYANVVGVGEDWQPIANPAHLVNLRIWLNLIEQEPKWCSTLFSALIINIRLTGTCVLDTDLFQRDISTLLNHPIEPIYNLAKQFTKLMPVFYNEIGAEGELRIVSTDLDETHKRKDLLIHFLRKQAHVESSNLIVGFIEDIFLFWLTLDKEKLIDHVPEEIFNQIETNGPFVDEQHALALRIREDLNFDRMEDILQWSAKDRAAYLASQKEISAQELHRFDLLVRMYKLLHQKYNLSLPELQSQLENAVQSGFPELENLFPVLEKDNTSQCLTALLDQLKNLQNIILSKETFTPHEVIRYKRHIAVDIPSVYGSYTERKFDALGLTFRLESLANVYLERLFNEVDLYFITQVTFIRIRKSLSFFVRALQVDGISSRRLETYMSLLASSVSMRRFSYTQHLDIMRGLSEGIKDIIYTYYTNVHEKNLSIIIPQIDRNSLQSQFRKKWDSQKIPETVQRFSEIFFRDLIANTLGLQHLDNFVTRIIHTLEGQKEILDRETLNLLMTYNPKKALTALYDENPRTHNLIHLGNKGFNLVLLARDGHRVPPAFILTTEVFRCYDAIGKFDRARIDLFDRMRHALTKLEKETGQTFGSAENPLLLSVRSGAAISMPGMMTTVHNVGASEDLVEEYVKNNPLKDHFAWDNYRRFLQSWGMSLDMDREEFQKIMDTYKKRYGVQLKKDFPPGVMRNLALEYKEAIFRHGLTVPEDPWLQLIRAVEMVLNSWNSLKAREYRDLMEVSDNWGTAVIVQAMVFGNRSPLAGSGVLFTAHPYRKVRKVALWGDYASGNQGEDIVSGLVTAAPISAEQAKLDGRRVEDSLENRFPQIYEALLDISRELVYGKKWSPQEIEFTFESPEARDLYILQTRDMITIKKPEHLHVFADKKKARANILAKGIGVSGSALSGRAVFTEQNIHDLRMEDPGAKLILIRQDTVPEDIREISMAEGLVTSRGGQTSHASVVATRMNKTCVVGCGDMQVFEAAEYAEIEGERISTGDYIAIDGRKGLLIRGTYDLQEEVHILPL